MKKKKEAADRERKTDDNKTRLDELDAKHKVNFDNILDLRRMVDKMLAWQRDTERRMAQTECQVETIKLRAAHMSGLARERGEM